MIEYVFLLIPTLAVIATALFVWASFEGQSRAALVFGMVAIGCWMATFAGLASLAGTPGAAVPCYWVNDTNASVMVCPR
jgi:hypothetical protein